MLTIGNLVDHPELSIELVVGSDLDVPIRWVQTSELADPAPYLEGGELVLTAGMWLGSGTSAAEFVDDLVDVGAAGIGFGLTSQFPGIPAELIEACRVAGLTLLKIEMDTPFLAISRLFLEDSVAERETPLRETVNLYDQLIEASRGEEPLRRVGTILERESGLTIWLLDLLGDIRVGPTADAPVDEFKQLATELLEEGGKLRLSAGSVSGHLIGEPDRPEAIFAFTGHLPEMEIRIEALIRQGIPFIEMVYARERAVREETRRFAIEFFTLLAAGRDDAALSRLNAFGVSSVDSVVAIVIRPGSGRLRIGIIERHLAVTKRRGIVAEDDGELLLLLEWPEPEEELSKWVEGLFEALLADDAETAIGFGRRGDGMRGAHQSLVEARHSCWMAVERGGACWASYREVHSYSLLLASQSPEMVQSLDDALLRPLRLHDRRYGSDLLTTLKVFFAFDGRWKPTAERLHIHINSLRHRISRIEELTGRDMTSIETRVDLFIALHAQRLVRSPWSASAAFGEAEPETDEL